MMANHHDLLRQQVLCDPDTQLKKILDIDKGSLQKGKDADICVFDIDKPWIVNKDNLKSKSKNTPIENRKLQGEIIKTFVKGSILFEK